MSKSNKNIHIKGQMEDTDDENVSQGISLKKRPKLGRMFEVKKKLLVSTHETGPDCKCSRHKCFTIINDDDRRRLICNFNNMQNYDEQNVYLAELIEIRPVARRRPRKAQDETDLHVSSYRYKVRIFREDKTIEVQTCYKAFLSLHGITGRRIQFIQTSLQTSGQVKKDGRGKHSNRPNKFSESTLSKIDAHIQSLKYRQSHYNLHDSKIFYLPKDLNIKKLHDMYLELNSEHPVSYETYRKIFQTKYNISFGNPRTCSSCDEFKVCLNCLDSELASTSDDTQQETMMNTTQKIKTENDN